MRYVVRGAKGLVIKNNHRVFMTDKGTNLVSDRVKLIDNDSIGSRGYQKCKNHQESHINVYIRIIESKVSLCVMDYLILLSLVYLVHCCAILLGVIYMCVFCFSISLSFYVFMYLCYSLLL